VRHETGKERFFRWTMDTSNATQAEVRNHERMQGDNWYEVNGVDGDFPPPLP